MAKYKLTQKAFDEKTKTLENLKTVKRAEISLAIKTAKEFGDLSENAEYSAAKSAQESNEIEIAKLEDILANVEIVDGDIDASAVSIGTTVKIYDVKFDEEETFQIVPSLESDSRGNKISDKSPIGSALIGHKQGDVVVVKTPAGEMSYKILSIEKTGE